MQITHNGEHIKNSKKISKNIIFWWGWVVRVKKKKQTIYSYALACFTKWFIEKQSKKIISNGGGWNKGLNLFWDIWYLKKPKPNT